MPPPPVQGSVAPADTPNYVDLSLDIVSQSEAISHFQTKVRHCCDILAPRFGFQNDSARNQHENITVLLANIFGSLEGDRRVAEAVPADPDKAVDELHEKTFASYEVWLGMVGAKRQAFGGSRADSFAAASVDADRKLKEIVLWWCIWGEAGNMRFMPEYISWLFHSMIAEIDGPPRPPGSYLDQVIKPMYEFVKAEQNKVDVAGNACDHVDKKNYDDVNEFFWDPVCLRDSFDPWHFTGAASMDLSKQGLMGALKATSKTYMERRGLLHSIKNNWRAFTVYIVLFHLLVAIGRDVPFSQSRLPLCPPIFANGTNGLPRDRTELKLLIPFNAPNLISCDINTARCEFLDTHGEMRTYDCLNMLTRMTGDATLHKEWDKKNDLISWSYTLPLIGSAIASLADEYDTETNLLKSRAWQLQQMDRLWEADADDRLRPIAAYGEARYQGHGRWGDGKYGLLDEHSGKDFFAGWNFYTDPDPTEGAVNYIDRERAMETGKYITFPKTADGRTQVRWQVDDTDFSEKALNASEVKTFKRDSIRLQSKAVYDVGKKTPTRKVLAVIDVEHIPSGISVWSAFWSTFVGSGHQSTHPGWPVNGEIDIIEGFNKDTNVKSTLHTTGPQWSQLNSDLATPITRKPCKALHTTTPWRQCDVCQNATDKSRCSNKGCWVEGPDNSFGEAFNDRKGGTFAMEWSAASDDAHVAVWFFPRNDTRVPLGSHPDPKLWGAPYANFSLDEDYCSLEKIQKQSLIFDTTLCGKGQGDNFEKSCKSVDDKSCSIDALRKVLKETSKQGEHPEHDSSFDGSEAKEPTSIELCNAFVQQHGDALEDAFWLVNDVKVYRVEDELYDPETAYTPKLEMLKEQDEMMLCDLAPTTAAVSDINRLSKEEKVTLVNAANISFCCQIHLSVPSPGAVPTVWQRSQCEWSFKKMWIDWEFSYEGERVHMLSTIGTLIVCRLLAELLELLIGRGRVAEWGDLGGQLVMTAYYAIMALLIFFAWVDCHGDDCGSVLGLSFLQQMRSEVNSTLQSHDSVDGDDDILGRVDTGRLFVVVTTTALVVELILWFPGVTVRLCLSCVPERHVTAAHRCTANIVSMFQPKYLQITGTMNSRLWLKYSAIWVVLVTIKCWFSYFYEIRLQVLNSATTWRAVASPFLASEAIANRTHLDQLLFTYIRSSAGNMNIASALVAITWLPTALVFLIDAQVLFTLFQMVFGVFDGIKQRIGHVNSWPEFDRRLPFLAVAFERRLNACATDRPLREAYLKQHKAGLKKHGSAAGIFGSSALSRSTQMHSSMTTPLSWQDIADGSHSSRVTLTGMTAPAGTKSPLATDSMAHFVQAWNTFVVKLRYDDYLSDREVTIYSCLTMPGPNGNQAMFPPLLMLGMVGSVLEACDQIDVKYRLAVFGSLESKLNVTKGVWTRHVMDFCRDVNNGYACDGVGEALETCRVLLMYLLRAVLGGNIGDADAPPSPHHLLLQVIDSWSKQATKLRSGDWNDSDLGFGIIPPFLQNWFQQPDENTPPNKSKGQLNRKALVAAISTLAKGIAGLGYRENGRSKQGAVVSFARSQHNRGFQGQKTIEQTRKWVKDLLTSLKGLSGDADVAAAIDSALLSGFFVDDTLCEVYLKALCDNSLSINVAVYLSHLMSTERNSAAPRSSEARRRFLSFASSLYMDMPAPRQIQHMRSLTTLTPMYGETVLYTEAEMIKPAGPSRPSMMQYLKAMHKDEWENLLERLDVDAQTVEELLLGTHQSAADGNAEAMAIELRLWASLRGQTLARTVHGVMQNEQALLMLSQQEARLQNQQLEESDPFVPTTGPVWASEAEWQRTAHLKYSYVVTCQIYGDWAKKDPKKKWQVDLLMQMFPHLRIAFVQNDGGKFYSCLVRWCAARQQVVQVYRIEIPGHILVGEGKPNNQNHAIIFTRGEYIQTLDMNQDGYFEESLKIRNLLQEFAPSKSKASQRGCHDACQAFCNSSGATERVRIVGFPEHQFSDRLSAVAEFAALTEFTFATLIQRTLASPFDVRLHYGHPDIFDKIFHITRGGISKANKTLCVSEDIFGGFNSLLKGGRTVYREYLKAGKGKDLGFDSCAVFEGKISSGNGEQALSRDFARITEQMDLPRAMSFFHSSNGFYWSNVLVIWATSWFLYAQILISLVIPEQEAMAVVSMTQSVEFAVQLGAVLTVPLIAELVLEKGPMHALMQMMRVLVTGGPFFFMFHIRTKAYYYESTLTLGGAKYAATGRGFVLEHVPFMQLFKGFHFSHLNYGFGLVCHLLVYRLFIVAPDAYLSVTWSTWAFALVLLYAPFVFNCLAFDGAEVAADGRGWSEFIRGSGWRKHFESQTENYASLNTLQKLTFVGRDIVFVIIVLAILLEKNASMIQTGFWREAGVAMGTVGFVVAVVGTVAVLTLICLANGCGYRGKHCLRRCSKVSLTSLLLCQGQNCGWLQAFISWKSRRRVRLMLLLVCGVFLPWVLASIVLNYERPIEVFSIILAASGYILAFATNLVFYLGFRPEWMYTVMWLHDATLGYLILTPFTVLSSVTALGDAHMCLLYNSEFAEVLAVAKQKHRLRQTGAFGQELHSQPAA